VIEYRIDRRSGVATYMQIVLQTKQALRLGVLLPGDKLPTAREVVEATAINPNTVLKAYRELEREGLVRPRPGLGTFVERGLGNAEAAEGGARPGPPPPGGAPGGAGARPPAAPAEGSPLRGDLARWVDRALAADLDRDDIAALMAAVLDERLAAGTTRGTIEGTT
jgi:GntR family transcriptional regulator